MTGPDAARDQESYAAVFAATQRPLTRFAYVLCGDADLAADAVAEAFARTYPKWRAGGVEDLDAYLRRAVVNAVHGSLRRRVVARRWLARQPGHCPAPIAVEDDVASREVVRRLLGSLPTRQRAVVVLRYVEDRSEQETGEILGITVGTVKSQASRGLAQLRKAIEASPVENS